MRSPLHHRRRRSVLPALFLLGAATTAVSLLHAPRAAAIGGGIAPAAQPTSPRETTGATPSVSLFQTSVGTVTGSSGGGGGAPPPAAASSEVTTPGTTGGNVGGGVEERPRTRAATTGEETAEEPRAGESAGRRRTARRREREESGTVTGVQRARTEGTVSASGGKGVVDTSKGGKEPPVIQEPPAGPKFTLSAGWQSRYIFHGLDIISFNSKLRPPVRGSDLGDGVFLFSPRTAKKQSSSIWFTSAGFEFKGFQVGVTYLQAVDPTVPYFQTSKIRPQFDADGNFLGRGTVPVRLADGRTVRVFNTTGLNLADSGNEVRLYREVDVNFSYTLNVIPRILDTTVGYNSYFFPNTDFKNTAYQGEVLIRLAYTQIPYIRPSFTFFRYISDYKDTTGAGNLNGNYTEFRIDGNVPVLRGDRIAVGIQPYVAASYNISYLKYGNGEVGGWNTFETGLKVPVTIAKHFSITPFGNYGLDISDDDNTKINNFTGRGFGERTRFWGGVNVAYTF